MSTFFAFPWIRCNPALSFVTIFPVLSMIYSAPAELQSNFVASLSLKRWIKRPRKIKADGCGLFSVGARSSGWVGSATVISHAWGHGPCVESWRIAVRRCSRESAVWLRATRWRSSRIKQRRKTARPRSCYQLTQERNSWRGHTDSAETVDPDGGRCWRIKCDGHCLELG